MTQRERHSPREAYDVVRVVRVRWVTRVVAHAQSVR